MLIFSSSCPFLLGQRLRLPSCRSEFMSGNCSANLPELQKQGIECVPLLKLASVLRNKYKLLAAALQPLRNLPL